MAGAGRAHRRPGEQQVSAPLGLMRVFPPLKITNEELGQIAEYDESLEGNHLHVPLVDPGAALSQHHWMTLFALEDGSADEVVHHIDHIIAQVSGQRLFQMDNVELEFNQEAVETAAAQAFKQKTGARGLRTILEQTLLDVMYELPSMTGISRCDVSREAIIGTASVSLKTSSGEVVPFPSVEQQKSA